MATWLIGPNELHASQFDERGVGRSRVDMYKRWVDGSGATLLVAYHELEEARLCKRHMHGQWFDNRELTARLLVPPPPSVPLVVPAPPEESNCPESGVVEADFAVDDFLNSLL